MSKATEILTGNSVVQVDGQPFDVVLEQGPRNWSAFVPQLPGCIATAATEDAVKRLLAEAIALHLEALGTDQAAEPGARQPTR